MTPLVASTPKVSHFFQGIPGYFDFEDLYAKAVRTAPKKAHFVEVGCWLGKSTAFLAVEIINSGKDITLDCIDIWTGGTDDVLLQSDAVKRTGDAFPIFIENVKPVLSRINPIKKPSVVASKMYEDKSLDFVFIDADHAYEFVKADIKAWLPKVKSGGILAGHDYNWPSVQQAVKETLGSCSVINLSWAGIIP
jgi:cephalosporin hydroxylase